MSKRSVARWLTAGAAAAWVLWSAVGARAQVRVQVGGYYPGTSIRFGGGGPPRPIVRVAPPGTVRYEHYRGHDFDRPGWRGPGWVGPGPGVAYRNPYAAGYFARFRPGYRPIVIGPTQYYAYPVLPPAYQTVVVNGATYYLADGIYYQPYLYGGQTQYLVVPPPIP